MAKALFALNPALDRAALAERFASRRRVQVRDVLTPETAREVRTVLERGTAWGLAIEGRETGGPQALHAPELRTKEGQARAQSLYRAAHEGAAAGDYAFRYGRYSLVEAAVGGWDPGGAHEILLEHFNTRAFLDLVQDITGFGDLAKADGHATLFAREAVPRPAHRQPCRRGLARRLCAERGRRGLEARLGRLSRLLRRATATLSKPGARAPTR